MFYKLSESDGDLLVACENCHTEINLMASMCRKRGIYYTIVRHMICPECAETSNRIIDEPDIRKAMVLKKRELEKAKALKAFCASCAETKLFSLINSRNCCIVQSPMCSPQPFSYFHFNGFESLHNYILQTHRKQLCSYKISLTPCPRISLNISHYLPITSLPPCNSSFFSTFTRHSQNRDDCNPLTF